MSQQDVSVAERAVGLWNSGERERFLALFHPEGTWSSAIKRQVEGGEGLYVGREEIGKFWDEWHALWNDLAIVVLEISSPRDGCVFAFGSLRASGRLSGADSERPFGWVFRIADGVILEVSAYLNCADALQAAGMSE